MPSKPPLRPEEVQRILRLIEPAIAEQRIVLVGGQAVAFWQRYLHPHSTDPRLAAPLTSKDIDFEGSSRAVRKVAELVSGTARIPDPDHLNTPNTGMVIFRDVDGVDREIDFIDRPLGLDARDVRKTAVSAESDADDGSTIRVLVLHPERCMESRIYNADVLHKTDNLAMRQLEVSIVCARQWSQYILENESVPPLERVRAVLRINERIFRRCLQDRAFRNVYVDHGFDPFEAVLVDDRLPERFRDRRYPQMQNQLEDRRKRDRRNRVRAKRRQSNDGD